MKRITTRLLLALMAVGFVACGKNKIGTVDQLDVFEPVNLESTSGEKVTLNPGSQPAATWLVKYNAKKNAVALKDKRTDEVYPIADGFTTDIKFLESHDATTPWEEHMETCWREAYNTICGRFGCYTQVVRFPGTQQVRERRVGSFDTYETNVNKDDHKVAYVKFTLDETKWETNFLSMCF